MKNAKFNKLRGNLNQADAKREKNERFYKEFNTSRDGNDQEYNLIKKTVEVAEMQRAATKKGNMGIKGKDFLRKCISEKIFSFGQEAKVSDHNYSFKEKKLKDGEALL